MSIYKIKSIQHISELKKLKLILSIEINEVSLKAKSLEKFLLKGFAVWTGLLPEAAGPRRPRMQMQKYGCFASFFFNLSSFMKAELSTLSQIKKGASRAPFAFSCGLDGTRTRDLRRDRAAF